MVHLRQNLHSSFVLRHRLHGRIAHKAFLQASNDLRIERSVILTGGFLNLRPEGWLHTESEGIYVADQVVVFHSYTL